MKNTFLIVFAALIAVIAALATTKQKTVSAPIIKEDFTHSSGEYALMGKELWSAWQCSTWASISKNTKDQERLFLLGYNRGKTFLDALDSNKIEQVDISEIIPTGILMRLEGPNHDFILGGIFSAAQDQALESVFGTDGKYNSRELQELVADSNYSKFNCQLIGK